MEQPEHIKTLFVLAGQPFRFNGKAVLDRHSWTHFLGSAGLSVVLWLMMRWTGTARPDLWGPGLALLLGVLWEVADGIKPLWFEEPYRDWRDHLLRADGCSWSDVAVDLWGVLLGSMVLQIGFGL
ncbi:MAG: hypothetical protein WC326_15510 [Candidatus Delongbacteria bacterium]